MCGRYTQTKSGEVIAKSFSLSETLDVQPRYNIAPSQPVGAIATSNSTPKFRLFQWGLIPSWSKDPKIGSRMINARAETAAEKPSFRAAFKRRRCLVIADGFYEWQQVEGSKTKQPFYIRLQDHQPYGFAGLWEQWQGGDGSDLETCTILTTAPNELMATIHNRMPVILSPEDYDMWLDPEFGEHKRDRDQLQALLRPYDAAAMTAYPVSTQVNNPRNEDPACLEAL